MKRGEKMKNKIILLLITLLTITAGLNIVSAENETEEYLRQINESESEIYEENLRVSDDETTHENRLGEEVKAAENGHFNISFDDGYNGYCINYGDHEATEGDTFLVQDTSAAINVETGESVGNYIKVFFTQHHDKAIADKIETQKIIWGFTGKFKYSNQSLLNEIRNDAINKTIPDHGAIIKINDTTEAVFDFEVLDSQTAGNQNFFAYKITYRDIIKDILNKYPPLLGQTPQENNTDTSDNNSQPNETETNNTEDMTSNTNQTATNDTAQNMQNETTGNNTENATDIRENNINETIKNNDSNIVKKHVKPISKENNAKNKELQQNIELEKHVTGYSTFFAILAILLVAGLLIMKYKKD